MKEKMTRDLSLQSHSLSLTENIRYTEMFEHAAHFQKQWNVDFCVCKKKYFSFQNKFIQTD